MMGACFWLSTIQAADEPIGEAEILKYITEESEKDYVVQNATRMRAIQDFVLQKAKLFAKQDQTFASEFLPDEYYLQGGRVQLTRLDEQYILLNMPFSLAASQAQISYFLIHQDKTKWVPIKFPKLGYVLAGGESYDAPILTMVSKSGYTNKYAYQFLFKEGRFTLIRTIDLEINPGKSGETKTVYAKQAVADINENVKNLYARFSLGGATLEHYQSWEKIYFITTQKAYFYEQPSDATKQKSYVVTGEAVYVSKTQGDWVYAHYYNAKNKAITQGWLKENDGVTLNSLVSQE